MTPSGLELATKLQTKKFWEEHVAYFALILYEPYRKRRDQQFVYCFCLCIRCRGNVFTKPLVSNGKGLHMQRHSLMGGIYEVRFIMGSGAMIHVPSFINIGASIQNLTGGFTDTQTV
jgi:hypothetical protein